MSGFETAMLWQVKPLDALRNPSSFRQFLKEYGEFKRQAAKVNDEFPIGKFRPILRERSDNAGVAKGHYFHQDLLVARRICQNRPEKHFDIGSRVDGFVAHVAAYRQIQVMDIRQLDIQIPNIEFIQADIMSPLPEHLIGSTDSLSCLHAIEHFGLGRYGDPVCAEGHLIALNHMHQLLKPGGTFYLSTPISKWQRVEFNAHRVFSIKYLLEMMKDRFQLKQFSYVDDRGDVHENVLLTEQDQKQCFGLKYGCGIFEMTRI